MFLRKGHRRAASLGNNLDNVVVVPANNAPGLRDTSANNAPGLRDTSANNAPGLRDTKSHNNASSLRSTNNKSQRSRDNNSPELKDDALRDSLSPTPLVRGVSPTQRGPSPVQRGGKVRNYSSLPVSSPTPHPDKNDSASNLSEPVTESLEKLKCAFSDMSTTITGLQREQENCKHKLQEDIQRVIIIRNQVQQEMEDQMYILHGEINTLRNQLNDDIEQLKYKSDERIRDLEDQLEKHKTAVALLEDRQAELPSDDIIPNDIRTRWRDLMSSLITLGLAVLSFLLFLFTTIVDFVKIFSENNALSTGLSLALFAVIIAAYYYFDTASRTMQS